MSRTFTEIEIRKAINEIIASKIFHSTIVSLYDYQINTIISIINNNTLGSLVTGSGKTFIYIFALFVFRKLYKNDNLFSLVVVPLNVIIIQEISNLKEKYNINSIKLIVGSDVDNQKALEFETNILSGKYPFVFVCFESLDIPKIRKLLFQNDIICRHLILITIDEVHCCVTMGLKLKEKEPFRKSCGNIVNNIDIKKRLLIITGTNTLRFEFVFTLNY